MTSGAQRRKSAAEWVTLSLSVLIVGALVVVALVEESRRLDGEIADLQVTFAIERTESRGNRFYVPYTVRNTGSEAITSAEIWIAVSDGERVTESAEVTVEFLPLQGTQNGVFVTVHDPSAHTLTGRLESLQFP